MSKAPWLLAATAGAIIGLLPTTSMVGWWQDAPPPVVTGSHNQTDAQWLADRLAYWQQDAPTWCLEDMACWIGSTGDDRSPKVIRASYEDDMAHVRESYGPPDWNHLPTEWGRLTLAPWLDAGSFAHDGCAVSPDGWVACPDGWVEPSSFEAGYDGEVTMLGIGTVTGPDGTDHAECVAYVQADDSRLVCPDGWQETS